MTKKADPLKKQQDMRPDKQQPPDKKDIERQQKKKDARPPDGSEPVQKRMKPDSREPVQDKTDAAGHAAGQTAAAYKKDMSVSRRRRMRDHLMQVSRSRSA